MALVIADRVKETTTTTGTGAVTLAGAATGYQAFSAAIGNGNTTYYCIADQGGANWETGLGTYSSAGNTLARTTVLASSNAGSLVSFAAGTKDVFVTAPAKKLVYEDASGAVVFNDGTTQNTAASGFGLKNRLLNGGMMIDQSNLGSTITPVNAQYSVDQWLYTVSQASKITAAQISLTSLAGFSNALRTTSSSAYSITSTDYFGFIQRVEGYNVADLNWGTANAATVTLSFWVRSSLTGTFGGGIRNSAGNRSITFSYTINAANTFEYKTITIPGDTTGTWYWDYRIGLQVIFSLGTGSTYSANAGTWSAGTYMTVPGAVSLVGTSGATFDITGVQLEKGVSATSFDFRDYGRELFMLQRYYIDNRNNSLRGGLVIANPNFNDASRVPLPTALQYMRVQPTITSYNSVGTSGYTTEFSSGTDRSVSGVYPTNGLLGGGYMQLGVSAGQPLQLWLSYSARL